MRWKLLTWIGVANLWGDGGDPIEVCVGSVDDCIDVAMKTPMYARYIKNHEEIQEIKYHALELIGDFFWLDYKHDYLALALVFD
ncbi:hypothetical protein A6770_26665 [Nostoc minutum NIES-26]|uniref:Uncharacterized protein n=1 Tax=Nostoc minutum NIES-26 TaxID=1844469 RepID=A0A367QPV0_9NOSO|nr:hypothetical protein A6770_26665 [Nostoc minutum NIES-26]